MYHGGIQSDRDDRRGGMRNSLCKALLGWDCAGEVDIGTITAAAQPTNGGETRRRLKRF